MPKEIKSTLELALERAAKLPALTAEEIRQRLEREYAPRGRAIAERFLGGDLAETRLEIEIGEFRGEEGEVVRGAFLASMRQSIDLEAPERTARAFEGVNLLVGDDRVEKVSNRVRDLFRDYQEERQREFAVVEEAGRELLRDQGISGSAIRLNMEQNRNWLEKRSRMMKRFLPRLEEIRGELSDLLSPGSESGSGSRSG
jgi:hypothetical protein